MIRSLIPYHTELEETPLYRESSRPMPQRFGLWTLMLLVRAVVVVLLVYGFFLIDDWQFDGRIYVSGYGVFILFLLSVLVMLYADYAGVKSGIQTVREGLASGKSTLEGMLASPSDKTAVYHAIARMRVWRLTMGVVGLRIVIAVLALIELYEQINLYRMDLSYTEFVSLTPTIFHPIHLYPLMGLALALYVIEPCFRMRLTSAFGIFVALRRDISVFRMPVFYVTFGYWLLLYIAFATVTSFIPLEPSYSNQWVIRFVPSFLMIGLTLFFTLMLCFYEYASTWFLLKQTQTALSTGESAVMKGTASYYPFSQRMFVWIPLFNMMQSQNPVFAMETRHLKRGKTLPELRRLSGRVVLRLTLITLILALGMFLIRYQQWWNFYTTYNSPYYQPFIGWEVYNLFTGTFSITALILAGVSIGGSLFLDFSCLISGMNSINRDMVAGRWDLLCLTMLSERQILMAKHAITQVRAWRTLVWISGMRVLSVLIVIGLMFVRPPYPGSRSPVESILRGFIDEPFLALLLAFAVLCFVIVYLLEPFWRFQAMTAMALSVSAGRNPTNSILMGLAAILGVWISQGIIIFALLYLMFLVSQSINFLLLPVFNGNYELMLFAAIFGSMIACFITGAVIFTYYSQLQRSNLQRVREKVFKT